MNIHKPCGQPAVAEKKFRVAATTGWPAMAAAHVIARNTRDVYSDVTIIEFRWNNSMYAMLPDPSRELVSGARD